ncbi:MAG: CHAD domain-containing protein, partial [Burkholderiales bacterium]
STLHVFRDLLRRKQADRFDRRLREALVGLGAARDWDVFEAAFGTPAMRRHSHRYAEAARRRARATSRSSQFRYLAEEVLAWARGGPWRDGATAREALFEFAQRALDRKRERLVESAEGVDWCDASRRHRVRIRVKRLRYGCECFAAPWSDEAMQPLLARLRHLQGILGELNDIDVQRQLLQDLAHAAATAAQVGVAMRTLARREQRLLAGLRRAWPAFVAVEPYWRGPKAAIARVAV